MTELTTSNSSLASGWSVYQHPNGSWHWSAFGPRGGTQSTAATKAEAEDRARREMENLRKALPHAH